MSNKNEIRGDNTNSFDTLLGYLREGELHQAVRFQRQHNFPLANAGDEFRAAMKQCVEIRMLLPGMSPETVLRNARHLVGDTMDFSEEAALLTDPKKVTAA